MFVMPTRASSIPSGASQAVGFTALALSLEAALVRMARSAGTFDLALGEGLLELADGGRVVRLGHSKITDYARERLGVPPSTALSWMQLARELRSRPILRRAVRCGLVSTRKAILVSRVAVGEDEAAWTAAASSLREEDLARHVKEAGGTAPTEWDVETLLLRMDVGQQNRMDAALDVAREVLGPDRPRWQLVEAIAMEFIGAHAEWMDVEPEAVVLDREAADAEDWLSTWVEESGDVLRQIEALETSGALIDLHKPGNQPAIRDARALDARLRRLLEARRGKDAPLGRLAEVVSRLGVWHWLGFKTFKQYCRERLQMSPRTVAQRIWLERRMCVLPEIREALSSGRINYTKALEVARGATALDVVRRIDLAVGTTCQQTARDSEEAEERQNRRAGVCRVWGPADAMETVRLAIACARAVSAGEARRISDGEALAMMANHFVRVWAEHVVRQRAGIGPERLRVLDRTGGLCAVPGCSRPAQHEHHVTYRSRGGGEEASNRVAVCDRCHLMGIHGGLMSVTGRAGERLVWRLGIEGGVPGEVWITEGGNDVRRA